MGKNRLMHLIQKKNVNLVRYARRIMNARLRPTIAELFELKVQYSRMKKEVIFVRASSRFIKEDTGR